MKQLIPKNIRLKLRWWQRRWNDIRSGDQAQFVQQHSTLSSYPAQLEISQPIKSTSLSQNKIHNLQLAVSTIQNLSIPPRAIFSFWNLVPQPNQKNGFKKGRNIIGDGLSKDFGGGLCQLSGILYHLSLIAKLEILERHPHSRDIYTEATRYTPLGSDATVVFAYKDLRFRNPFDFPISFDFEILSDQITATLCAPKPIQAQKITFQSRKEGRYHIARVNYNNGPLISEDRYLM